jgi:hypothetical protein
LPGEGGVTKEQLATLENPTDMQLALQGGNFIAWCNTVHASLKDEPTRGLPLYRNDTSLYAAQSGDHPKYALGPGAYYDHPLA